MGADLGTDLQRLLAGTPHPVVFDIGANVGEFLTRIRVNFPAAVMHVFEPSPAVFQALQRAAGELPGVTLNNIAMGPRREERLLQEHSASQMSSLLPPGPTAWSEVRRETPVRVETVDAYCAERGIPSIDLLKIDTQGYDLEVLRGVHLLPAVEQMSPPNAGPSNFGLWGGIAWFPFPHFDLRGDVIRRSTPNAPATTTFLLQLNGYL